MGVDGLGAAKTRSKGKKMFNTPPPVLVLGGCAPSESDESPPKRDAAIDQPKGLLIWGQHEAK